MDKELHDSLAALDVRAEQLALDRCNSLLRTLRALYANPLAPSDWGWGAIWNWQRPSGHEVSVVVDCPVDCVSELVGPVAVILVFAPNAHRSAFSFGSGREAALVADHCCSSEYGFTDEAGSYLIWYNHHEYLIALGLAMPKLRAYAQAHGLVVHE